jgi:hypothetical protein
MRHAVISVFMVMLLVLGPVAFINLTGNSQAQATEAVTCTQIKVGTQIKLNCTAAGIVVLHEVINLPSVTVPGNPITIRTPGHTTTVRVPGPTQTITAPGAITTSTDTTTITQPAQTATVRVPGPTATQTTTVTAAPRQTATDSATIDPTPDDSTGIDVPGTNLSPPEAVGIGTLAIIAVACLILLGMYIGYYMGYKDSDKAEAQFYRSLLGKN